MSDNQITGYCLSMLLEGFETSSGIMSYTLFEVCTFFRRLHISISHSYEYMIIMIFDQLARHPDVQRKAQQEVDLAMKKSNGRITDELVQELQYLDGICYGMLILDQFGTRSTQSMFNRNYTPLCSDVGAHETLQQTLRAASAESTRIGSAGCDRTGHRYGVAGVFHSSVFYVRIKLK